MNFRRIELLDKNVINTFLKNNPKYNCDFCFTNIYLLKDYYNTEIFIEDDTLYLRYQINNEYLYFIPLGNVINGIDKLIKYTKINNQELKIINIEENDLQYFNENFKIIHMIDNDDYVYSTYELSHLSGKKFKAKRNLVNSFQKKYTYNVNTISSLSINNINLLNNESFNGEKNAIMLALKNINELNLDGIYITIDDKIVGLTLGTYMNDTFITHFEKVDYTYLGIAQATNYFLANYLLDKVKYINREEDLGIAGIRNAKNSYNPIKKIKSYTGYYKKDY